MSKTEKILVKETDGRQRLDIFLAGKIMISRSQIQKMIEKNLVTINGVLPKKMGAEVKSGDEVKIVEEDKIKSDKKEKKVKAKKIVLDVVEDTNDYVVINKPAGLLVHPTEAKETGTLVEYLLEKYPEIKNVGDSDIRPGIVHRLDREASGLMVIAKNQKMFNLLKKQFQDRTIKKEYLVLVYENVIPDHDEINFDIDRGVGGRMVSRPNTDRLSLSKVDKVQPGKTSSTEFFVEKRFTRFTLLRVRIHTGRTHQIRVHMLAYNHPVVGDTLYINKHWIKKTETKLGRLFLHSTKLCFTDLKKEKVCFEAKLPKELVVYLKDLK